MELPSSKEAAMAPVKSVSTSTGAPNDQVANGTKQTRWQRIWPVVACGSGLFSDGYINSVIGSVSAILRKIYGSAYTRSNAERSINAITFVGTVIGQLIFGYTSDKWSRKNSLLLSTAILIVFATLSAGAYGYHGSTNGLFAALAAYRFLVGIGIGGEYPAGSVACSEATGELKSGTRNRWFIMFTNVMIDWGVVAGAFVPFVVVCATGEQHLRAAWRIMLGIGVVPPSVLLLLRMKLKEPEEFKKESMKYVKIPYKLVLRYYGYRLFVVSLIWFIYDFSSYSFSLYSPTILENIIGKTVPLSDTFGWNTVITLFYIPGAMLGAFFSDLVGPRYALAIGAFCQAIVGFIMASLYKSLSQPPHIGGFAVVYGLFLSLGEFGPGNNIGLVASKTCATGVRGQYYAIAAAIGKLGAFVGTYVFPYIQKAGGSSASASAQYPFYVSSSLGLITAGVALFMLPNIGQDTITKEDIEFRAYLEKEGWDTTQLGLLKGESVESKRTPLTPA